jgi:hypothetical protein
LAVLAPGSWVVLALAAVLAGTFDYNLWDNFEYFTPILEYTHGLWLKGSVPLWNSQQHMGEPLLAAGQPGALYFPYTLALLLTRLLRMGPERLMLMIVSLHLPFMVGGWFLAIRRLDVRPAIAAAAAISVSFGGFLTTISTAWIFMFPTMTLMPWILYGLIRQLTHPGTAGAVSLVIGLVATACLGHPQMLLYQWMTAGIFLAGFGIIYYDARRIAAVAGLLAIAVVLSLPAVLPITDLLAVSVRSNALSYSSFIDRSITPVTFVGWLLPIFRAPNGILDDRASVTAYEGAWVIPAVFAGLIIAHTAGRSASRSAFWVALAATALILALAVGGTSSKAGRAAR